MAKKYLDEFCVLGNYELHISGDVYNRQTGRKLHPSNELGYDVFRIKIPPDTKSKAHKKHRLVATYFIPNPNNLPMVNHIDGNKKNCYPNNLEWCDAYHNNKHARDTGLNNVSKSNSDRWNDPEFRSRTSKNISSGMLKCGAAKGENNPRFRYRITINGKPISRSDLAKYLNMCQSATDANIKKAAKGKKIKRFIENNIIVIDTKHES